MKVIELDLDWLAWLTENLAILSLGLHESSSQIWKGLYQETNVVKPKIIVHRLVKTKTKGPKKEFKWSQKRERGT